MKKKELEQIPFPDVPEELVASAQNDRREEREYKDWDGKTRKVKSYSTRLYFSAEEAGGKLIVQMWTRAGLAKGDYEPKVVVYIDPKGEWVSNVKGRWTESLLWRIREEFLTQRETHCHVCDDVHTETGTALCNAALNTDQGTIYESVVKWQIRVREEKNRAAAARRKEKWDGIMALVPDLPEDFEKWLEDVGTIDDNFLLFRRAKEGGFEVFCTHCGKTTHMDAPPKHNPGQKTAWNHKVNHVAYCKGCGHTFETKKWGVQKRLRTDNSVILPQVAKDGSVLLRRFEVIKSFSRTDAETPFSKWEKNAFFSETRRIFVNNETFASTDSFTFETVPAFDGKIMWRRKRENSYNGRQQPLTAGTGKLYTNNSAEIMAATKMPEILYRKCGRTNGDWPQTQLRELAKKKYIEYLEKSGLTRLAEEAMEGRLKPADKDARNLKELLGIDGQQLRTLKDMNGCEVTLSNLIELKKRGEKVDQETLLYMNSNSIRISNLQTERTGMSVQRTMNYLRKQAEKEGRNFTNILFEYRDYIEMAFEMGRDITDDIIRRTPDLKAMHDRYAEERNRRKEEKKRNVADLDFRNIAESFAENKKHFGYELRGMMIVVPRKASDIITEGQQQHHCVGASNTYMKRMAEGESFILFLRKKEAPKEPYYTLEVEWGGKIRQSYAAYDRRPDAKEINDWLAHFTREIGKRAEREKKKAAAEQTIAAAV